MGDVSVGRCGTRVALVHDWLNGMRGGEKVLAEVCGLFPDADLFTLLFEPARVSDVIRGRRVEASWLQRIPGARRYYRHLLPLMPAAIESFDLSGYDLVLSTSHCVAKGVRTGGTPHLSYCFTPMRYLYDQYDQYFGPSRSAFGGLTRAAMKAVRPYLTKWDRESNAGVTRFVADSAVVAERIRRVYDRDAEIIHPPVDVGFFTPDTAAPKEDSALIVSALTPYKRVDLAVDAARLGGFKLVVAGSGPERARLERRARGADVTFMGWRSDEEIRDLMRRAAVFLYPQTEDFGITAVEAQACGTPVVAYAEGGALETVLDGSTGLHFKAQDPATLAAAVADAFGRTWNPDTLRGNAERFSAARFRERYLGAAEAILYNQVPAV